MTTPTAKDDLVKLVERLLDNAATGSQERRLFRDEITEEEGDLRKIVRLNVAEPLLKHIAAARAEGFAEAIEMAAKVCESLTIEHVGNSALTLDQCAEAIRERAAGK